jgi:hypothetical protein
MIRCPKILNRAGNIDIEGYLPSGWLWKMHKTGQLPDDVPEAFNNLFQENGYDMSQQLGYESLMDPGAIPVEDFEPDWLK